LSPTEIYTLSLHDALPILECPPQLFISSYPGAIAQIMTNLMINALTHAFPDPLQNGHIVIRVWQQQDEILLSCSDDGRGMDEARSEEHTSELQSRENLVCR